MLGCNSCVRPGRLQRAAVARCSSLRRGTLGPEEYSVLRLAFTPKTTGTFSAETFALGTLGGNRVSLSLRGTAVAPRVTLSALAFNFGNVAVGTSASRVLYLRNHSPVPVPYDFQAEPHDVFSVSRTRGVLAPESTAHVTLSFRPATPSNHWRRVALLLKDAEPQGLDLLATAFSDKGRPPPLELRHLERYLARTAAGGPAVEEAQLDSKPPSAASGSLFAAPGEFTMPAAATTSNATANGAAAGLGVVAELGAEEAGGAALTGPDGWSLLFGGQDPGGAVSVDTAELDFGSVSRLSASEYRSVTVTNHTPAKLSAFIAVPDWADPGAPAGEAPKPVFQVFPDVLDVRPFGSATFKVAFRPSRDGAFVACGLSLVAAVKAQRNFRLVADHQVWLNS
jgi:hypothetical protein